MRTGWVFTGGAWYYLNADGKMATGWKCLNGTWYYLESNGSMHVGWLKDSGKWYWLDGSGAMATGARTSMAFVEFSGAMASATKLAGKIHPSILRSVLGLFCCLAIAPDTLPM